MNFVTNTEEMLNKDPEAQAQLELCLVRMPNQNISDEEARTIPNVIPSVKNSAFKEERVTWY